MVDFRNGNRIEWVYSAEGTKLRKTVYDNYEISYFKDYAGGFIYKTVADDAGSSNTELEFLTTSEGKAKQREDGSFYYVYDIKDHLGNVRVSFTDDGNSQPTIVQQDSYYPFGMRLAGLSTDAGNDNKYLYNGKELEDDFKLNWYHYGARYYDPQLGRWLQVDPADEFNSPYVYVGNMPTIAVDPDGKYFDLNNLTFKDKVIFYQCVGMMKFCGVGDEYAYINTSPEVIHVIFVRGKYGKKNYDRFESETNTIFFNPDYDIQHIGDAYYKKNEVIEFVATSPPVVSLFHEMCHAVNWLKDPDAFEHRYAMKHTLWRNYEEKKVIKRENIFLSNLSNKLGLNNLGQRETHSGIPTLTNKLFEPSIWYEDMGK